MTVETLLQIMPRCPRVWAESIIFAMPDFDINTPLRQSAFIAQLAHESSELTRVEENLNYSADRLMVVFPKYFPTIEFAGEYHRNPQKIANLVYADRMGNGNTESNDGWTFHGRGGIQLTGRDNYFSCGKVIGVDLIAKPQLLLQPTYGIDSSCWFWVKNKLNELSDVGDFRTITRRVNGGLNGYLEREKYYEKAKNILFQ